MEREYKCEVRSGPRSLLMALVQPKELVQGAGRGQKLRGRMCDVQHSIKGNKDMWQGYLVTGPGLDDMLFIEAWRDHARTAMQIATEGKVVEIMNLTLRALSDKAKYQTTSLDIYGQVLAATKITPVDEDERLPRCPGMVLLENPPWYKQVPHLINVAGTLVDMQVQSFG